MQCINNLKQVALAMHNFHDAHSVFPPGMLMSKKRYPIIDYGQGVGEFPFLLPYLELTNVYARSTSIWM